MSFLISASSDERISGSLAIHWRANAARIAYSPLWTEMFDNMIRVQSEGTLTPQAALDAMRDDSRGEEIALFRTAFIELWRLHQNAWGPLPADLGTGE